MQTQAKSILKLDLPPNQIYSGTQELHIDNVAVLFGENGSGKSFIIQSIFEQKMRNPNSVKPRIVCCSSGQNENYTKEFNRLVEKKRKRGQTFNHECFFYDKSWVKLLIFLALAMNPDGKVSGYFKKNPKYAGGKPAQDFNPIMKFDFKIDSDFLKEIQEALESVEGEQKSEILKSSFYNSLLNFVIKKVLGEVEENSDKAAFQTDFGTQSMELTAKELHKFATETRIQSDDSSGGVDAEPELVSQRIKSVISFFSEAANEDRFIDKTSIILNFDLWAKQSKEEVELDDFSDGEYQILFILALIDLFDDSDTLFLLDEVDSHLHHSLVMELWSILHKVKGYVIATTHQIESIANKFNKLEHLHFVEDGIIKPATKGEKLLEHINHLSSSQEFGFEVSAQYEYVALIDDYNDWTIFTELARRKGCNVDCDEFKSIQVIKQSSDFSDISKKFAYPKINWVLDQSNCKSEPNTKLIFLVCDRDEAPLKWEKGNGVEISSRIHTAELKEIKWTGKGKQNDLISFLLAWKRREIKNYLLSFTALSKLGIIEKINNEDIAKNHYLEANSPGENESIKKLDAKEVIDSIANNEEGLDLEKLKDYIALIPPDEISVDILNMFNFIVGKIREVNGKQVS